MRKFPVGKLKDYKQEHLGVLINRVLNDVFRPFLEKSNGAISRMVGNRKRWKRIALNEIQNQYPALKEFTTDGGTFAV